MCTSAMPALVRAAFVPSALALFGMLMSSAVLEAFVVPPSASTGRRRQGAELAGRSNAVGGPGSTRSPPARLPIAAAAIGAGGDRGLRHCCSAARGVQAGAFSDGRMDTEAPIFRFQGATAPPRWHPHQTPATNTVSARRRHDADYDDARDVDFAEVEPSSATPAAVKDIDEGQGEEDDGPDPAKDLAERVMQAVFEWNNEHEVVDADIPWLDVEAIAEETFKEQREMQEFMREQEEQERAAAEADRASSTGFVREDDVDDQAARPPYRPPPEGTNIFEPTFDDEEEQEEELDLLDPDALTAALARGQEFLYGFDPSQLPQDVLEAVEAAGDEARRIAYSRLLAGLSSEPYQNNLRLARQLRWTARVLVPTDEGNPIAISDEALTEANAAGVKELVEISEGYSRSVKASTGGWCLWLMKFLRNRDEDSENHLALDDETVGMMYDLRSQAEKDKSRMKVGARMFRKALESEVFKLDTGGLLSGRTTEQLGEYTQGIGQRIFVLAGEMQPAHDRANEVLRELTRQVFDEMASLAYDKVLLDMNTEVSPHRRKLAEACPMTAAGVLKAIAQVAFYVAEPMVYLKTGEAGLTTDILQNTMDDLRLLNTVFLENPKFYEVYARDSVVSELTAPAPAGTMKIGGRLLRHIMGMYKEDAVTSNTVVLAEELSQRLFDADEAMPDVRRSWDNLMWNLEFDDEDAQSQEFVKAATNSVLAALVEKLIKAGMEKPTPATAEMCARLGMGEEETEAAFSRVSGDIFEKSLLEYVRDQGTAADGTPTTLFRSDPLSDEELQELKETAAKVGVSESMALEVVAKEMQVSLTNLITRAGKCMRNNVAKEGARIIQEANDQLDGLCTQLVKAFGGADITATLSIAGQLPSLDEYWASELCFKMVDAVRDPEGAQAEAGIPGALTSTPQPEWEDNAQRILELLGLGGQR